MVVSEWMPASVGPSELDARWIVVAEHFAPRLLTHDRGELEVAARETRFGRESFTRTLPNGLAPNGLAPNKNELGEDGLIAVGAMVRPGDVLAGKVSPPDLRDTSLRVPPGMEGVVVEAHLVASGKGEVARARVVVAWDRPLSIGDELEIEGGPKVIVAAIRAQDSDVSFGDSPRSVRLAKVRSARDVIHARSIGPYSLVTQQPLSSRAQFGGQQVTEEQARALIGGGGRWVLAEMFTIKSDDVVGRTRAYESLVKGENPAPYRQGVAAVEIAHVLKAELAALGFDLDWKSGKAELRWLGDAGIQSRSSGEVKKPETINYRTFLPEDDGLFCARIFGPVRDYECKCGKYKRMKNRGVICEECGVAVVRSKVRRERFGRVTLTAPILHPWLVADAALLLDRSAEEVLEIARTSPRQLEALLAAVSLDAIEATATGPRADLAEAMLAREIPPTGFILHSLLVLPPDLRPLVPLEGGRFATSDLNDLYRRVINRNNRLRRLIELNAPEAIIQNEIGQLHEAVGTLFANGRKGTRKVKGPNGRRLVPLLSMIDDRLASGLVSKRVDYSGVAMLVVDPTLERNECRLPHAIVRELFRPMAYNRMEMEGHVTTIKAAKQACDEGTDWALKAIESVSRGYPAILMSGARIAIRKIRLWDWPAIAVDPTTARDLDEGSEVRVHIPLTEEARAECERFDARSAGVRGDPSGWFEQLRAHRDRVPGLVRAAVYGEVDPLDDPVFRIALGLAPSLQS